MSQPRRTALACLVVAVLAAGAWLTLQYPFGYRCWGRLATYKHEAIHRELPPGSIELSSRSVHPHCGLFPKSGVAELRLASTMSQQDVVAWYQQRFGDSYALRGGSEVPIAGVNTLFGTRRAKRRLSVVIRVGPASSTRVFPSGTHISPPEQAVSVIDVQVGDY